MVVVFLAKLAEYQPTITRAAAAIAHVSMPSEKKEIAFERHPLQTLYHLLKRTIEGQGPADLHQALCAVPESLRDTLFYEVWAEATDLDKEGDKWGEIHAFADLPRLLKVIETVATKKLEQLPFEKKKDVFSTLCRTAGQYQTPDPPSWGAIPLDPKHLIHALHSNQCLDIPGESIRVFSSLEKDVATPSHLYDLGRPELPQGRIGFINGLQNSFEHALQHAKTISTDSAQGYNLHCTYSATIGMKWDFTSAALGQGGLMTPAAFLLLQQWLDFFENTEDIRLLQLCHSRGAIEVNNALNYLPDRFKSRIIVIAIAPGCFIEANKAYRVVNLANLSDPVTYVAENRDQIGNSHIRVSDRHEDTLNPHSPHGSSFREKMDPMIETYIRTNDII